MFKREHEAHLVLTGRLIALSAVLLRQQLAVVVADNLCGLECASRLDATASSRQIVHNLQSRPVLRVNVLGNLVLL